MSPIFTCNSRSKVTCKLSWRILSVLLVVFLVGSLSVVSAQTEYITNGGFEEGPLYFTPEGWSGEGGSTVTEDIVHSGNYSLFSYSDGSGISQTLLNSIVVGSISAFSIWVYGANTEGTEQKIILVFSDSSNVTVSLNPSEESTYEEIDILAEIPGGYTSKILTDVILYSGTGNPIYYDDLTLTGPSPPTPTPAIPIPTPRSFLYGIYNYIIYGIIVAGFLTLGAVIVIANLRRDKSK